MVGGGIGGNSGMLIGKRFFLNKSFGGGFGCGHEHGHGKRGYRLDWMKCMCLSRMISIGRK